MNIKEFMNEKGKSSINLSIDEKMLESVETEMKKLPIVFDVIEKLKLLGVDLGGIEENFKIIAEQGKIIVKKIRDIKDKKTTEIKKKKDKEGGKGK